MQRLGHLEVVNKEIYQHTPTKDPIEYGVVDRRLGICQKQGRCATCNEDLITCPGMNE
jgi:DNA-directed RNA polymerase III subunit RPC1